MLETVVDDKTPGEVGGRAAGVPGPVRHHLVETDIEHDTAEIEQQDVDGGGRWRQIHGNRLQNWTGLSNGAMGIRFEPNPALKPVRELC